MIRARYYTLAVALILAIAPAIATASCLPNKMTYGDIEAVRYANDQSGDWLLFWSIKHSVEFDGRTLGPLHGQYKLQGSLEDALTILKRRHFFSLVPRDWDVTDTAKPTVSVERCGIVTRITAFMTPGENPELLALFKDFESYIIASKKTKLSDKPRYFPYLMFGDYDVPTEPSPISGFATPASDPTP